MLRTLLKLAAVGLIAFFVLVVGTIVYYRFSVVPELRGRYETRLAEYTLTVERHAGTVCEDLRAIAPFFAGTTAERDAGAFLNPKIAWHTVDGPLAAPLTLDAALLERIEGHGAGWPSGITRNDYAKLDFAWMKDLRAFDHWDVTVGGPFEELARRDGLWIASPVPDVEVMRAWVKLRLARDIASGDAREAVADVRHLARLLYHSGVATAPALASIMLHIEREAYDATAPGARARKGWTPLPQEELARFRRVGWFFPGYHSVALQDPRVARFRTCAPAAAYPCSSDVEDAALLASLRTFLERGEPALYARFEKSLGGIAVPCRAAALGAWASRSLTKEESVEYLTREGASREEMSVGMHDVVVEYGRVMLAQWIEGAAERIEKGFASPASAPATP